VGNILFLFFMLFFLVLKAATKLVPLIITIAIWKGIEEYINRGRYFRNEVSVKKPSRLKGAIEAYLHPKGS